MAQLHWLLGAAGVLLLETLLTGLFIALLVDGSILASMAALLLLVTLTMVVYWIVLPRLSSRAEPCCRKCGYVLRGIREPRCPECGERI